MKLSLNLFGCGWENRVKSKLRETNDETFWKCQKTYIFKKFKPAKITRGVDLILNQQQQILSQSSLLTLVHLCSPPPPAPPPSKESEEPGAGNDNQACSAEDKKLRPFHLSVRLFPHCLYTTQFQQFIVSHFITDNTLDARSKGSSS